MNLNYIDSGSTHVKEIAKVLIENTKSTEDIVRNIFYYVRDEIEFGFLPEADFVKASDIILRKKGQCNNKTILFKALCEAAGIEARIHYSSIDKAIHTGLYKGLAYKLLPREISHSWIELKVGNEWVKIDSFINDLKFYEKGRTILKNSGKKVGYSVSCSVGDSSADFSLDSTKFVQMGSVREDHGVYDDPQEYFSSEKYNNNPGKFKMFIYRRYLKRLNARIEAIRNS
ncbi:MAG: transglutaminase family protein [Eubacterium sp.]|jgi:hypothetical protein|nr:transglutaminase family protein [Eubacterium sp.]